MLLVVVYGVYTFFFTSAPKPVSIASQSGLDALNTFIAKVADTTKAGLSETESYIIRQAAAEWQQDPLLNIERKEIPEEPKEEETPKETVPQIKLNYTGFLQMGDKRMAIINGMEYEAGERLIEGDYIIKSISPTRVVINAREGMPHLIVVPLDQTE